MEPLKCPACDHLLPAEAVEDGWCPACGKKVPEFIRKEAQQTSPPPSPASNSSETSEPSWWPLILLGTVGISGGVLFGMAKHGQLTGPWVIVPILIVAAFAVGRVIELRKQRQSRARQEDPKDKGLA